MKRIVLLLAITLTACLDTQGTAARSGAEGQAGLVEAVIPGPSLEGDLAGDVTPLKALIYLPPSYAASDRKYPVLVLLHGFWSSPDQWQSDDFSISDAFDDVLSAGTANEMIVVMPSGRDKYNGGFFVNGAATGDWEDYIAEDVIAFVDQNYRTLATRESRGIAGHSMGGYGALSIAAARPDVFSAVYAMSPCCGDLIGDFGLDAPTWAAADTLTAPEDFAASEDFHAVVLTALGAAWAPDAEAPLLSRRPVSAGVVDDVTLAEWQAHTLTRRIADNADNLRQYSAIGLDVGDREDFPHILQSVPAMSAQLTALGIAHDFEIYPGDHVSGAGTQIREEVLPFFSEHLSAGD